MNAWYNELLAGHAQRARSAMRGCMPYMQQIDRVEQMLTDEGMVLLKFWIHLSKEEQKAAPARARHAIRARNGR